MSDWLCSQCGEWHSDHPSQSETKTPDLVERLEHCPPFSVNDCRQAATELRSLRSQLAAVDAERRQAIEVMQEQIVRLKIASEALEEIKASDREEFTNELGPAARIASAALSKAYRSLTEGE